jgi:hypothetical protein
MLAAANASLASSALAPWSRWITPRESRMVRKRFDARFFVAALPPGQEPLHDQHETTDSVWVEPKVALAQFLRKEIQLAPPQVMSLAHLARYRSVDAVLAAARAHAPPCIQPEVFADGDARILTLPGDERHSVRVRALPGPTRLVWRNEHWEPEGGLEALCAEA